jgi:hypothetical protein
MEILYNMPLLMHLLTFVSSAEKSKKCKPPHTATYIKGRKGGGEDGKGGSRDGWKGMGGKGRREVTLSL